MRLPSIITCMFLGLSCLAAGIARALPLEQHPEARAFAERMQSEHGFEVEKVRHWLEDAVIREDILRAISRPAEKKPWYEYRPIFLTESRIEAGVEYFQRYRDILREAEEKYGVASAYIVAIIGVETRYGLRSGSYRVIDALSTLAFAYPPRSTFFRSELEHFLIMTREENVDPLTLKGSYAGAMGHPQFISSSFRRYAVDFDGDGQRDIWNNTRDVIGSVANYLAVHGWRRNDLVALPLNGPTQEIDSLYTGNLKNDIEAREFRARGMELPAALTDTERVSLLRLDGEDGPEQWLGLNNFYVITRYNHSALYAMAVHQLAEEISKRYANYQQQPDP